MFLGSGLVVLVVCGGGAGDRHSFWSFLAASGLGVTCLANLQDAGARHFHASFLYLKWLKQTFCFVVGFLFPLSFPRLPTASTSVVGKTQSFEIQHSAVISDLSDL